MAAASAARVILILLLLLGSGRLPAIPASGDPDPATALDRALVEAEESLRLGEVQVAESRYRSALLEGWLLMGALEVAEGRLSEAKAAFEAARVSSVETRRAVASLALVLMDLGEAPQAVSLLRDRLAGRPDDVAARRLLARALVATGRPGEAVQELEDARTLAPDDPELAFALATGHLRLGNSAAAAELFAQVAALRPLAETQVLIGRTYRDFREYSQARAALQRALEMNPQVRRAHYYLGTVALMLEERAGIGTAIRHFQQELRLDPEDPLVNFYLGSALAEERRFQEALPTLEIASRVESLRLDALRYLGRCYLGLDRPADAAAALQTALELATSQAGGEEHLSSLNYQLGLALRRQGDEAGAAMHFAEAERHATRSVATSRERLARYLDDIDEPEISQEAFTPPIGSPLTALDSPQRIRLREHLTTSLARAYFNLGVLHTRSGRFARAARLLRRSAGLDPGFPQVQRSLGVALFNAQRFDEAIEPLGRALEQEPDDDLLRRTLALAHLNAGGYERTAELLREDAARSRDPNLQYAYIVALVRSDRGAEARPLFEKLLTDHADWPELHVLLGQALAQDGDYPGAIGHLQRAVELDGDVAEARSTWGEIYLRQGRLAAAEEAFREELEHHPDHRESRYLLATVLEMHGRSAEAEEILESLLEAEPSFADGRYLLGKILLAGGAAERAVEQLEAAAALAPDDANIRYQLVQAYQRLERPELARRELEIYRDLKKRQREGPP